MGPVVAVFPGPVPGAPLDGTWVEMKEVYEFRPLDGGEGKCIALTSSR